jgi:hypothetical protein
MHDGGLSSREGLAVLIHDGYTSRQRQRRCRRLKTNGSGSSSPSLPTCCIRPSATATRLSAALRDSWDGVSIRPATKTSRLWASNPHITLTGNITPSELLGPDRVARVVQWFCESVLDLLGRARARRAIPQSRRRRPAVTDLAERTKTSHSASRRKVTRRTRTAGRCNCRTDARAEYARLYRGELSSDWRTARRSPR